MLHAAACGSECAAALLTIWEFPVYIYCMSFSPAFVVRSAVFVAVCVAGGSCFFHAWYAVSVVPSVRSCTTDLDIVFSV